MSEDFGKWLKENKENRPRDLDAQGFGLIDFEEVVSVRALGEECLRRAEESFYFEEEREHWLAWLKLSKEERVVEVKKFPVEPPDGNVMWLSLAVDFLGKVEVERRLCVGGRE
ncbi:MAG TPA: hypothetical protein VMW25_04265 [Clostridia bacterium]|nr:hypothetical protein [Clostridia bacterium]